MCNWIDYVRRYRAQLTFAVGIYELIAGVIGFVVCDPATDPGMVGPLAYRAFSAIGIMLLAFVALVILIAVPLMVQAALLSLANVFEREYGSKNKQKRWE